MSTTLVDETMVSEIIVSEDPIVHAAEEKRQFFRNKKYPAEQVRKRHSYKWMDTMLINISKNTPQENLVLLVDQLMDDSGYFRKRGARPQFKRESMELAIKDYNEKNKSAIDTRGTGCTEDKKENNI